MNGKTAGAFFSFTSNVDAHFYDFFEACEINDCHGNIELWQCSNRDCSSGIWRAPIEHKFAVDKHTTLAHPNSKETEKVHVDNESCIEKKAVETVPAAIGCIASNGTRTNPLQYMPQGKDQIGWYQEESATNWPKCGHCKSQARPAIFMFGDFGWKYDVSQTKRWELWKQAVLELEDNLKLCIIEIGCGTTVRNCREMSEQFILDAVNSGGDATLVRINLDAPFADDEAIVNHTISIESRGLPALKCIDRFYSE